ncbi:MAG: ferrous iron transport protein B [Bacteroidales bacterium]|nr:ferrous iron transport protein B [Bacteroidales bacterium]
MKLSDLKNGETAVIIDVAGHGGFRKRIMEMGFVRGKQVQAVQSSPMNDPVKYSIMGYDVSLRRSEAAMIEVLFEHEANAALSPAQVFAHTSCETCDGCDLQPHRQVVRKNEINVALVGNPNSGKTSLFNALSGSSEHVGNYSGVTVDAKTGHFNYRGYRINLTDLPGTYSLSAYSPEEIYIRQHLYEQMPDVIINAVVASNLERNLYLTTELIDLNQRTVVALNMYDELEASGAKLNHEHLGAMLGIPMTPTVARSGKGLNALLDSVIEIFEGQHNAVRHIHIGYGEAVEREIAALSVLMRQSDDVPLQFPVRYWALKLLEGDKQITKQLAGCKQFEQWREAASKAAAVLSKELGKDVEMAISDHKYGFIDGALHETFVEGKAEANRQSRRIDRLVANKWLGFPIFIALMWLMFTATFTLGAYPQGWIESLFGWLGSLVAGWLPDGAVKDLIVNGIIGGVGSVAVFLPNILILYLFISLMEDSGYMARAAFIMDKLMHRMGLHGKSFIPLLMGFGCNVPAIMATRTIESHSSRLITILVTPFMSCSARLPVFILLAGTFFPRHAATVLIGLYLTGGLVAVLTARLLRATHFKIDETPFVMELPPYRWPTLRATLRHMWDKCAQYLKKIGSVILVATVIIWFLSYFPRPDEAATATEQTLYEQSYMGRIGKFIEPAFRPLGLTWRSSAALLASIPAKELVVSSLGVLYSGDADDEQGLSQALVESGDFTPASALAFMVFILLFFPCLATIAAVAGETGRWAWGIFTVVYNTAVAWALGLGVYCLVTALM